MVGDGAGERIVVVEDDPDARDLLVRRLWSQGYKVAEAEDAEEALEKIERDDPDLVLLDVMLPGESGFDFLKRLRAMPERRLTPVVILSALSQVDAKVHGFESGADDYVTKPFSPKQLIARIRAVLRRGTRPAADTIERIDRGPLRIDTARHEVRLDGMPVTLTLAEFRILHTLAANPDRVFTRDQLLDKITQGKSVIIDRNVDVHVRAIRKKLGKYGERIVTVRGVGYKCTA